MPAFRQNLSDREIWQMALFAKQMDKLPPGLRQAYLPHNEFDPSPGVQPLSERKTARYGVVASFEINLAKLRRVVIFGDVRGYFGDTRPQTRYTYDLTGLAANLSGGFGYRVSDAPHIEIRDA
jgi:hypothetical protein